MALGSWAAGTEPTILLTFGDALLKSAWAENDTFSYTSLPDASTQPSTLLEMGHISHCHSPCEIQTVMFIAMSRALLGSEYRFAHIQRLLLMFM